MEIVGEPKFVCPTHHDAKQAQTLEFGAEKGLLVEETPTWKMGDLDSSPFHLSGWPGCKIFKDKKGKGERSL